ncbi:MAG TPA: adenine phosphoribosyltransferase [Armatimonadota bacterium]|nr:adenine phosphoribosyltransferase [Armatimonadota bacterium]HOP81017.1 adenine phosphoribosyltransferase [Armatimonadota bacterium]HPP75778.1 adenine phosphoribosyltransferase [Armatimonadota bacterium]
MIQEQTLKELIRDIPDFPTDGILFRDITPVLQDAKAFKEVVCAMADKVRALKPDVVVGIESRGFVLGAPISLELGVGFVPVRKIGKLPAETIKAEYALEYGTNVVEIHKDAIRPGQKVVIVDDLLATGGTASASVQLVEELGGEVAGVVFLVELTFLNGRDRLKGYFTDTLVSY